MDAILAQDPAGVYRSMDFATRDRYRKKIEKLARHSELGEITISQRVVQTAALAARDRVQRAAPSHGEREHETLIYQPVSHIGYYLIDDGRVPFELSIGYRNTLAGKWRRWLRYRPTTWYFPGIAAGTGLALWGIERFARAVGGALPWPLRVLAFLPSSEVATQVVNYAVTRLMQPRALPKMEFKDGVPPRWKTIIAIPMLLGSVADGVDNAHQLEIHYLSNPDPNLRYALLADYTDAPARTTADDAERWTRRARRLPISTRVTGRSFFCSSASGAGATPKSVGWAGSASAASWKSSTVICWARATPRPNRCTSAKAIPKN